MTNDRKTMVHVKTPYTGAHPNASVAPRLINAPPTAHEIARAIPNTVAMKGLPNGPSKG